MSINCVLLHVKADYTLESHWGDVEMTESLYRQMKKSFDEEELALNNPTDMITQMASPDFNQMLDKKWTMPIEYTLTKVTGSLISSFS